MLFDRYVIRPTKVTTFSLTIILPHERINCLKKSTYLYVWKESTLIFLLFFVQWNKKITATFVSYLTIHQRILYLFPVLVKRFTDAEINRQSTPSIVFMGMLRGDVTYIRFFGVAIASRIIFHIWSQIKPNP